jgi:AraC-like DNA-binding protein
MPGTVHGRAQAAGRRKVAGKTEQPVQAIRLAGKAGSNRPSPLPDEDDRLALVKLLAPFCDVVEDLGGRPGPLLEAAGIDARSLTDPTVKVPLRAIGQLLEDTAAALGCPDLGLRLAENHPTEMVMKPLDCLLSNAPTIRDTITCCIDHMEAFNSGLLMGLDNRVAHPHHCVTFELIDGMLLFPQLIEQLVLLTHNSYAWLSAGFARSRTVWFSHLNISTPVTYARHFNTTVKFGQEYNGLILYSEDMAARVANGDAQRFALESRIIAERYPVREMGLDVRVRQLVHRMFASSDECTRERVAKVLGFQERTLNRRLSKLDTSFEAIRDEVRRNLAYRYLVRADLPLTEIAGRLGYSELAVLSRSCRRWFGVPPGRLRQIVNPHHCGHGSAIMGAARPSVPHHAAG